MDSEEKIRRGQQAGLILSDPLIVGFFTNFEKEIFARWRHEPDSTKRDELYMLMVAADAFKAEFISYISTGQLTEGEDK